MGGLSDTQRGCSDCWEMAFSSGWVGQCPDEAAKMEYLYTTSREVGAGSDGGSAGVKGEF